MTLYAEGEGRVGEPCDENDTLQLGDVISPPLIKTRRALMNPEVQPCALSSVPFPPWLSLLRHHCLVASVYLDKVLKSAQNLFFLFQEMKLDQ